jgi:hypothetical protein
VYPDYRYPPRGQKRKGATSRKVAASAAPSEPVSKSKKLKVLTHRPRYIEPAIVPEFSGETFSATEAKGPASPTQMIEEPAIMPKAPSGKLAEPKTDKTEEPKTLEVLSPSAEVTVLKAQKGPAATPKKKDGKCTRCARVSKGFKFYSFRENCRGFENVNRSRNKTD